VKKIFKVKSSSVEYTNVVNNDRCNEDIQPNIYYASILIEIGNVFAKAPPRIYCFVSEE
jgi:hypothetical protein